MKIELTLKANSLNGLLKMLHEIYEGASILKTEEKSIVERTVKIVNGEDNFELKISTTK